MFKIGDKVTQTEKETPYLTLNGATGVVIDIEDGYDGNFIRVYFKNHQWNEWLFLDDELTHV